MSQYRAYYTVKIIAACLVGNVVGVLVGFAIWEYVH